MLGQGLKRLSIGQKLNFVNHPYLHKGLYIKVPIYKKIQTLVS
ncbi:hypothetical protein THERMOT_1917 [Bathymodiolus thermophilus thioautotrophic gill symbiont]|uniref:Uncharacterized protein n=1 Tax=Bathymodiolus thermophilus thioautotrophic gill symbiont TaxID=2360 RepID=A0A8H8XCJ2_9GAMM|nr:hypothetical protein THERMOS_706 [Bathymodiolus thermophilus thioautotrophic gill symbiont]CAB5504167.1 hypothetical protein THERMOT_1917 [Bathymodiolus thermophilus thioautotrophic gill symbiont]